MSELNGGNGNRHEENNDKNNTYKNVHNKSEKEFNNPKNNSINDG